MSNEELKQKATEIRDETRESANTANRVGTLFLEMIEHSATQQQGLEQQMTGKATKEEMNTRLAFVKDLGQVNTSGTAENAAIALAGDPNLRMIHYTTSNGQVGTIRQYYSNLGFSMQFLTLNGTEFVRVVYYDSGMKSAWRNIDKASLVYKLLYNAGTRRLEFHDPIQDEGFGGVTLPEATINGAGLMSALDKQTLGRTVYLGMFSGGRDAEAKAAEYASDRSKVFLVYDLENGKNGVVEQFFSNTSATIQFLYLNGSRYVREVRWAIGEVGAWKNVTGSERISGLAFDSETGVLSLKDALGARDWGSVTLPIAELRNSIASHEMVNSERYKELRPSALSVSSIEQGEVDIKLQGIPSNFDVVYLIDMGGFVAKSGEQYYSAWAVWRDYASNNSYGDTTELGVTVPIIGKLYVINGILYVWNGEVMLRFGPTAQPIGMSADETHNEFIYRGPTVGNNEVSTEVLADVNILSRYDHVKIVAKSWGTSGWVERFTIKGATSGAAGVMTGAQCEQLERLQSFLSKLESAFGTTDLDTIVARLNP